MHDPNRIILNTKWFYISRNEKADRRVCPFWEKMNILRYSLLFRFRGERILYINRGGCLNNLFSNLLFKLGWYK